MSQIVIKVFDDIKEISDSSWNALVPDEFCFQKYQFINALIRSECIHPESGQKAFFICASQDDKLLGILPCYLKGHSYGEYLFDWQWANHFQMNGLNYYPKLMAYTPFTPIIGPKFLSSNQEVHVQLLDAFIDLAQELNCFSASFLFPTPDEALFLNEQSKYPMRKRINYQYNWQGKNHKSFDDFLSLMRKNKRKSIKKERLSISEQSLSIRQLSPLEVSQHASNFYLFYQKTIDKKYSHAYLNPKFFDYIFNDMKDEILLHEARDGNDQPIANSLSLFNSKEIFGRYWGGNNSFKNLHFELCYYQNIDFAIENNIPRIQAGAQGTHKIARGFLPEEVCSFHYFLHPQINESIQSYIAQENQQMDQLYVELMGMGPYKQN